MPYAEVIAVKCENIVLLKPSQYEHLKQAINTLLYQIIHYMDKHRSFVAKIVSDELKNFKPSHIPSHIDPYYAASFMHMKTAIKVFSDVICELDDSPVIYELTQTMRTILEIHMTSTQLNNQSPGTLYSDMPKYVKQVIEFVKTTYLQHKDDVPQTTVWAEPFDYNSTEIFYPEACERLWIYIDGGLVSDYIKSIIANSDITITTIKSYLYTKT